MSTSNQLNFDPPGRDEIAKILKKLKTGKAASDIPPSFIKCAADSNEVMSELVKLYRLVWETEISCYMERNLKRKSHVS